MNESKKELTLTDIPLAGIHPPNIALGREADSSQLLPSGVDLDPDSRGEEVRSQFFQTSLCLPVSGCPPLLPLFRGQVNIYLTASSSQE